MNKFILYTMFVLGFGCSPNVSEDQKKIRAIRQQSNEGIAQHKADLVTKNYTSDFTILTSANFEIRGRDKMTAVFRKEFDTKKNVTYVRIPTKIIVNKEWRMASENGHWTGRWQIGNEWINLKGNYYAKWHKVNNQWKIRAEVYTPLQCSGGDYCNKLPRLQKE